MKYLFCLILLVVFFIPSHSKDLKFYFKNLHREPRENYGNIDPLYLFTFDTLRVDDIDFPVILPKIGNIENLAFSQLFFTGRENAVNPKITFTLFKNYNSDTIEIFPDLNGNMDFTDDSISYFISKKNPFTYINLPNSKNPDGKFQYKIGYLVGVDSMVILKYKEHFYNDDKSKGFITTDSKYWISETRLNVLSCDTVVDGDSIQIGLMDWNCNGLYNDIDTILENNFNSDRILVGYYGNDIISHEPSAGASILLPETFVDIRGRIYQLIEIEPTGKYAVLRPTNKTSSILRIGDDLPDLKFKLISGDSTSLRRIIVKGKYNLIDMWSIGCKGCIMSIPKFQMLDSLYHDKFNIIALHDWQSAFNVIQKYIEKKSLKWTNGILTPEIAKNLLASGGYPYYILVDPDGKIFKFNAYLNEVENLLKKFSN
ncbi:MAG: redoxin domain-containing protein [Bacteroidetes bacterium]|nr:MAG: redoxin domain-containing protein [Bacteroidota bacterium]